jgi:hypothetical protein
MMIVIVFFFSLLWLIKLFGYASFTLIGFSCETYDCGLALQILMGFFFLGDPNKKSQKRAIGGSEQ